MRCAVLVPPFFLSTNMFVFMQFPWAFSSWILARQASHELVFVCARWRKQKKERETQNFCENKVQWHAIDNPAGFVCVGMWVCVCVRGRMAIKYAPQAARTRARYFFLLGAVCVINLCSIHLCAARDQKAFYNSYASTPHPPPAKAEKILAFHLHNLPWLKQ